MANDATKITVGKPKVSGALFRAPLGTPLPTDATTELNAAFINLGFVNEDGIVNANDTTTEDIKAWGGNIVLTPVTETKDTFEFTLLQILDSEAKKLYFGDSNVSGNLTAGMTVKVNSNIAQAACYVIEMLMGADNLHRIVIPVGAIAERSEITYTDGEAVGYGVKLNAQPDSEGNTHYEYTKKEG